MQLSGFFSVNLLVNSLAELVKNGHAWLQHFVIGVKHNGQTKDELVGYFNFSTTLLKVASFMKPVMGENYPLQISSTSHSCRGVS